MNRDCVSKFVHVKTVWWDIGRITNSKTVYSLLRPVIRKTIFFLWCKLQCICKSYLETGWSDPWVTFASMWRNGSNWGIFLHVGDAIWSKAPGFYSYDRRMDYTDHFQSSSGHRLAYSYCQEILLQHVHWDWHVDHSTIFQYSLLRKYAFTLKIRLLYQCSQN
jgi:hypothetical protein